MDQNINKKVEISESLRLFFVRQKKKIVLITCSIFLILVFFSIIKIHQERENILISEKFIQANIYLSSENKKKSLEIYEEIIKSKNKFYSILALNTILEKKLENDEKKIINYFNILQDLSMSLEQKDLLTFKKALFLIQISKINEGENLLKNLSNSDSYLKDISDQILEN